MASKVSQDLEQALEDLARAQDLIENVGAVEKGGAHIVTDWRAYPGLTFGLDAAGNVVRVEFEGPGWRAED